jgi:chemotaxis protein MotA
MNKRNEDEGVYFSFLRMAALGFVKNLSPIVAVELARRAIPHSLRPSFKAMDGACRGAKTAAAGDSSAQAA